MKKLKIYINLIIAHLKFILLLILSTAGNAEVTCLSPGIHRLEL